MRVLIADDVHIIADTLALIFQTRDIEAKAVYSGEEVLEIAGEYRPNAVVCDVVMGGINGFEVGAYLRSHLPECSVVLFSGEPVMRDMQQESLAKGLQFDVLTKPVPPRLLLDYVEGSLRPPTDTESRVL